jgi:hypothetical protein
MVGHDNEFAKCDMRIMVRQIMPARCDDFCASVFYHFAIMNHAEYISAFITIMRANRYKIRAQR